MPVGIFPTLVPPNASGNTELHTREIPPDVVTILLETFPRKVLFRSIWAIILRK